ncbi:hypothetical protein ACEQPO_14215 [Bacillus sp. SL00103]
MLITEYYVDEFEALREKITRYDESIKTIADLRAKFDYLDNIIETKQGAQSKADAKALARLKIHGCSRGNIACRCKR